MWFGSKVEIRMLVAILPVVAVLTCTSMHAQDLPDPNPRPNPDGTYTWWVGNNMQYPLIQEVLDAAFPGDEIVIMPGLYVEDLTIRTNHLTVRPACLVQDSRPVWGEVALWNPTEGFVDGPWCVRVEGSVGSYIGRPRQYVQLANGAQFGESVDPGEWNPALPPESIVTVTENSDGIALTFLSRDVGHVAVYALEGTPTFHSCYMTSQNGFGGAILATGDGCEASFVDCTITSFQGEPGTLDGMLVNPVAIFAFGAQKVDVRFRNCVIKDCVSGPSGVVTQAGGSSSWTDCVFEGHVTPVSNGIVVLNLARAWFTDCIFRDNVARFGTVRVLADPGGLIDTDVIFNHCDFLGNDTVDGQYGGVLSATGLAGDRPPVELSECGVDGNNGHEGFNFFDIDTPFEPFYRIGRDIRNQAVNSQPLLGDLNEDGVVDGQDLLILLSNW